MQKKLSDSSNPVLIYKWQFNGSSIADFNKTNKITLTDYSDPEVTLILRQHSKNDVDCQCLNYYVNSNDERISFYVQFQPKSVFDYYYLQKYRNFHLKLSFLESYIKREETFVITDPKMMTFGICDFAEASKLIKYVNNSYNNVNVVCEIRNMSRHKSETSPLIQRNCKQSFKSFLKNDTLSDVILNINELKIPGHKLVLSARSAYFAKMFSGQNLENSTNEVKIEFESKPFLEVLNFMYCQEPENLDTLGIDIFKIAHYYQIEDLQALCENFFKANLIRKQNVIEILKLADDYDAQDLKDCCIEIFTENFNSLIIEENEVTKLLQTNPHLGYKLLKTMASGSRK